MSGCVCPGRGSRRRGPTTGPWRVRVCLAIGYAPKRTPLLGGALHCPTEKKLQRKGGGGSSDSFSQPSGGALEPWSRKRQRRLSRPKDLREDPGSYLRAVGGGGWGVGGRGSGRVGVRRGQAPGLGAIGAFQWCGEAGGGGGVFSSTPRPPRPYARGPRARSPSSLSPGAGDPDLPGGEGRTMDWSPRTLTPDHHTPSSPSLG